MDSAGMDGRRTRRGWNRGSRNPLSIVIPCHRVVGANGKLTGYAGGLARKRALLELESVGSGFDVLGQVFAGQG